VDYNCNKPHTVLTAGEDRLLRLWDLRQTKSPLKILSAHSHWVCSAKYNPFHDQLLASGGSDSIVNLWRIASCSSAPWLGSESGSPAKGDTESTSGSSSDPPDIKVRSIDQHEDSVLSIAWSPADAWMYCSLSFDGRYSAALELRY
jgi:WD40 repeat protein